MFFIKGVDGNFEQSALSLGVPDLLSNDGSGVEEVLKVRIVDSGQSFIPGDVLAYVFSIELAVDLLSERDDHYGHGEMFLEFFNDF